jgi:hypothetical protein
MTKKKRTPTQKLARQIQAETGKPYTACLAEAKKRLAEQQRDGGEQP